MLRSMYAGISGMKVNQTKLDVIGNNIANVGTTAFKSSRVRFQDMLYQNEIEASSPSKNIGGVNPGQVGLGTKVSGIDRMVSQGMMQPTGRNLDVAMDGMSYFLVARGDNTAKAAVTDSKITTGGGLNINFTRDGAFALDEQGNLLTSDGLRVLGYAVNDSVSHGKDGAPKCKFVDADTKLTAGNELVPLAIPDEVEDGKEMKKIKSFNIEKDGQIRGVLEDGKVTVLGQIAMASFKNPEGLKALGKNQYLNTSNSGEALIRTGVGALKDNGKFFGDCIQGVLEMANVDIAEQFTEMIVANRSFQANTKMITTGDEILQDIVNLKR